MKNKWFLIVLLVTCIGLNLIACGNTDNSKGEEENVSKSVAVTEDNDTNIETGETKGDDIGLLNKGDYVVGLSNSYIGNTWRKQMVESFSNAAEQAKSEGLISDYIVQNGDGTVNAQIAQINSFILQGVDAICICAASPTALNSTIQKALDSGIEVIAFDSIVELDGVYTMDYPWVQVGTDSVNYVADRLNGKGNVIVVRGVSGAAPDKGIYEGITTTLEKYPDIKIIQEVIGEASSTKTQEELIKVLPSLDNVDAVITHCGNDAIGVVNAFKQFPEREIPIIIGDNTSEFLTWWQTEADDDYITLSQGSTPGCGAASFWVALNILNGYDVPEAMMLDIPHVTKDNLSDYEGMKAGTFVSPEFTNKYVVENIIGLN